MVPPYCSPSGLQGPHREKALLLLGSGDCTQLSQEGISPPSPFCPPPSEGRDPGWGWKFRRPTWSLLTPQQEGLVTTAQLL